MSKVEAVVLFLAAVAFVVIPLLAQRGLTPVSRVVDSNGKVVGTFVGSTQAARQINGVWVSFIALNTGFVPDASSSALFLYTTPDCTHQAYIAAGGVLRSGEIFNNVLYYPANPLQLRAFRSVKDFSGQCTETSLQTLIAGPVASFNLSTLGLVPPFEVK